MRLDWLAEFDEMRVFEGSEGEFIALDSSDDGSGSSVIEDLTFFFKSHIAANDRDNDPDPDRLGYAIGIVNDKQLVEEEKRVTDPELQYILEECRMLNLPLSRTALIRIKKDDKLDALKAVRDYVQARINDFSDLQENPGLRFLYPKESPHTKEMLQRLDDFREWLEFTIGCDSST